MSKKYMRLLSRILVACLLISCMSMSAYAKAPSIGDDVTVNHGTTAAYVNDSFANEIYNFTASKATVAQDGTITVSKPNPSSIEQRDGEVLIATWVCIGAGVNTGKGYTEFDDSGSVTFTPTSKTAWFVWVRQDPPKCNVTYDLNSSTVSGYNVYPVEAFSFDPTNQDLLDGLKNFEDIPVCFFTADNVCNDRQFTAQTPKGGNACVGMGLENNSAHPYVDFLARKDNGDGTYSYKQLTGWTVQGTNETVVQGAQYHIADDTESITFVANWENYTIPANAASDGPALTLATQLEEGYDALIYQSTGGREQYYSALILGENENTIYYKAYVKMNPLIASTYLLGGRSAAEGFASFDIKVELDKNLELVAGDDGNVSIAFKCSFLVPENTIKVNDTDVAITSSSSDGIWTITAEKSAVDAAMASADGDKVTLDLPVKWDVNANTSSLADEMYMSAAVKVKDDATATEFHTTGEVTGKIDLAKAGVNAHQVIRYILGDPVWKNHYLDGKDLLDITDTLRAVAHLEAELEDITLKANELTAKLAYVRATGLTLSATELNLVSNDDEHKTAQLTATVAPPNATTQTVTWSSDNESVAIVDENGLVTAVAPESTVIHAKVVGPNGEETTVSCQVHVTANTEGITLSPTTLDLTLGGTVTGQLTATVSPENATDKTVTWSSSNTSVATVDGGVVRAVGTGTAIITAAAANGQTATCTVTVTDPYVAPVIPNYGFTFPTGGTTTTTQPSAPVTTITPDPTPLDPGTTITDDETPLDRIPLLFTDVRPGDWYRDAVAYVFGNGLMNGVSETVFAPNMSTERGMIVTILHRLEGEPYAAASAFADVEAGQWYSEAIGWAAANGVVTGYSETVFRPTQTITREQLAAILYRYAQLKGYDTTKRADLSGYADSGKISAYALDAMGWAVAEGLISGVTTDTLAPRGLATRAQVATILMRYCENIVPAQD